MPRLFRAICNCLPTSFCIGKQPGEHAIGEYIRHLVCKQNIPYAAIPSGGSRSISILLITNHLRNAPISPSQNGRFAARNMPFGLAKRAVLHRKTAQPDEADALTAKIVNKIQELQTCSLPSACATEAQTPLSNTPAGRHKPNGIGNRREWLLQSDVSQ